MSINLLEQVQINLGYPSLQKMDPNTQEMVLDDKTPAEDKFSQAAIPAILIGMYKYVQTDEGADNLFHNELEKDWLHKIFSENDKEIIETIAAYAEQSSENPIEKMNAIANEAIKITKDYLKESSSIIEIKNFFYNQKLNFLLYLPPHLNIGTLLNDGTLDDKTNKMEGPISSVIKSIGSVFSNPTTAEEINN